MFNWSEIAMFFAGYLFGCLYFWKEILDGLYFRSFKSHQAQQQTKFINSGLPLRQWK